MVAYAFNAQQYTPSTGGGGSVLETGRYVVQITASEFKQTKRRDGNMLVLSYSVMSGNDAGKRVLDRLNLDNPNPEAVKIAHEQLSAIAYCTGRVQFNDTQELHGIPMQIDVEKVARQDDPTRFSNNIIGYYDANGNPPGGQAAPGGGQPPQPAQQPAQQPQGNVQPPAGNVPWQQPAAQPAQQGAVAPPPQQQQQPWNNTAPPATGGDNNTPPWQR